MSLVEHLIRNPAERTGVSHPSCAPASVAGSLAKSLACLLSGLMSVAGLVACGPDVIKGRPPFIGVATMSLQGERLTADFRVSNQNGVPMTIQAYELAMKVDNTVLVQENRTFDLAIDANSAEELRAERDLSDTARELLGALETQQRPSLPFTLSGRVRTLEDGYLGFEQTGHLYPVPGRPGYFRSAVTQARGLRREDDL